MDLMLQRAGLVGAALALLTTATVLVASRYLQLYYRTSTPEKSRVAVLFISLELADPLFSGNGVYARTVLQALLSSLPDARAMALCGRPSTHGGLGELSSIQSATVLPNADASVTERLSVKAIALSRWGSLDRTSDWRGFEAAEPFRALVSAFEPTHVLFVDWTGARLVQNLFPLRTDIKTTTSPGGCSTLTPRLIYLNFRVFSSNRGTVSLSQEDQLFYSEQEKSAVLHADVSVALCPADAQSLNKLAFTASTNLSPHQGQVHVLNPPLREDLRALAVSRDPALKPERTKRRKWLLCCTRLSREKNVELFIETVAQPGMHLALEQLGVVPFLVGSGPDGEYVKALRDSLMNACPFAMVQDFVQGDPSFLAQLYSETALNFHPALYEAYGMTVVEAAAFGAPSLFDSGGDIGVASRLRPEEGEAMTVPLDSFGAANATGHSSSGQHHGGAEAAAVSVLAALKDEARLKAVGQAAQVRSISWNMEAFGADLVQTFIG
jgi:glycosyltransferase involved in cell wall biosynthesis